MAQKILSKKTFTNILNLRCDLDLECSNPIFPQNTPNQVWLQMDQQFRRHSGNGHILIRHGNWKSVWGILVKWPGAAWARVGCRGNALLGSPGLWSFLVENELCYFLDPFLASQYKEIDLKKKKEVMEYLAEPTFFITFTIKDSVRSPVSSCMGYVLPETELSREFFHQKVMKSWNNLFIVLWLLIVFQTKTWLL